MPPVISQNYKLVGYLGYLANKEGKPLSPRDYFELEEVDPGSLEQDYKDRLKIALALGQPPPPKPKFYPHYSIEFSDEQWKAANKLWKTFENLTPKKKGGK